MRSLAIVLAIPFLVPACAAAPPEPPLAMAEPPPVVDDPPASSATTSAPGPATAKPTRKGQDQGESIPDDYQITNGDCDALGKRFAFAWKADETSKLSPKLSEKQRSDVEKNLEEGGAKAGDKFAEGCAKSLVGKSSDPKSLKCALDARSIKAFDACLNGEEPPKK